MTTREQLAARNGRRYPRYRLPESSGTVLDAARARIRWLYREFPSLVVESSGGKDSTAIVEMTVQVARELGRLPVDVLWLDQECEYQSTVDYQRYLAYEREGEVRFHWYQVPFRLENSTNHEDPWLYVWDERLPEDGSQWMRPKEPTSIHYNTYGADHFYSLLTNLCCRDFQGAILDGIRADESPSRRMLTTATPVYKWVTWASRNGPLKRFHPIYDWTYRDVWKAVHEYGWRYNTFYDVMFRYGTPIREMRVSNFHHETALRSLMYLQEFEPETWERATRRLSGLSTWAHLDGQGQAPTTLPYMFRSWPEYAEHLIRTLPPSDEARRAFHKHWERLRSSCAWVGEDAMARVIVREVIHNDLWGTHSKNFRVANRRKKEPHERRAARSRG